ncbi:MAG: glycosyltransferase [Nitrospirae bacterium]|nr:glycosyltransferase [Nitrospirota bacterium]
MGHHVQVLGATKEDIVEEAVDFVGSSNQSDQERLLASGRIRSPDVIFLEGAFAAADFFRSKFPKAKVVHIGQNIDRYGSHKAFQEETAIDIYALVGQGQLAEYCVRYPRLRHKFMLIRNVVPWNWLYQGLSRVPVENRIVWVGAWTKKGLRSWAETMQRVLWEHPSYRWTLYGPCHGAHIKAEIPPYILRGLRFRAGQLSMHSLPLAQLAKEISSARVVLVSLGIECGPISTLDAHAMGRPVLSGNDMVYKYCNPEGAGIRVTTAAERYQALIRLINDPLLSDALGTMGQELIISDYVEKNQRNDLNRTLGYLRVVGALGAVSAYTPPMKIVENVNHLVDKIKRKVLSIGVSQSR